ncbi:Nucleoside-diphosphate-sugar epimerase [Sphingomonas sp. EC-HK361]|uniref:NAD-dependent epimerase/dehydratase family protein n=1 Tax=Sphingomonas sp. EC-HK361 TaxID=2038397 RepID=UPI001250F1C9|nr:NAD(P)-dependent oxidoreductase [Sphingomonas sp. EC-HK361]VVT14595.1 Nucleoside-diphosphate-sugar epimerase [Sphingomonas sp. EC-HK361]
MILAITGGTGFVGGHTIRRALEAGYHVRALTRRPQPVREGVSWVAGGLSDSTALADLMRGADAVLHIAGVVNASDRAGFAAGNIDGTASVLAAASDANVARFVHVSSLAAREPALSTYGWSKAEAEHHVQASDREWTIVRPPGVYGPGDMEMRDLFRVAKLGIALLPPPGRISLIAVDDLARLLVALAEINGPCAIIEADDGAPLTHEQMARAIGRAVGQPRILPLHLPRALLSLGARIDGAMRGKKAKLTPDRVGYLAHADWTADPVRRPPPDLWTPAIPLADGFAETARWYRAQGLL